MREDDMDGTCSTHRRDNKRIQILVGKCEEKRPLGKARRRWEDNITMDLRKIR
jgi:hypothetical protein